MKRIGLFTLLVILGAGLGAQNRKINHIPDIPGYHTLVCDFHMHTVFSDGSVWPTVRVNEAWYEGIDAIAITDHLEYKPHKKDISADHNRSVEIAQNYAKNKDVIVIAGTEITKNMPPGHFNALFIKDANPIFNDDYLEAIKEAAGQGAFIIWNHPGWKAQQPDTMRWWDEHTVLFENGLMHGIEVANGKEYYPEAINWARDKNLTFLANSDVHSPINMNYDLEKSHRTCTLVFATEHSEGGVREALFNGRTIAYFDHLLMGKEEILSAFLQQSLFIIQSNTSERYSFVNPTDFILKVRMTDKIFEDWNRSLTVLPGEETVFSIPAKVAFDDIELSIENFLVGDNQGLTVPLSTIKTIDQ
jgi:3',5'-nucleoside bisphosphate phosphatase